jgi:hypothetical protein
VKGIAAELLATLTTQPMTCDQLEMRHGLTHQTCSASVNWLMRHGKIVRDGYGRTRSNRRAIVWRVAQPGEAIRPPATRKRIAQDALAAALEANAVLRAERDEARREICVMLEDATNNHRENHAKRWGWDCFKEDGK